MRRCENVHGGEKLRQRRLASRGRDSCSGCVRVGVTSPGSSSENCIWCRCFPNQAYRLIFFFFFAPPPPEQTPFSVIKCTLLQQRVIAFDFEIDDATSPVLESNINHSQSYHIRGQTCFGTIDFFIFVFFVIFFGFNCRKCRLLTLQTLRLLTNLPDQKLNWKRSFSESFKSRPAQIC